MVTLDDPKEGVTRLRCVHWGRDRRGRGSGWSYGGDGCVPNGAAVGFIEDNFVAGYDFHAREERISEKSLYKVKASDRTPQ